MKKSYLNVLVACERSQTVCKAFRALGHNAFSNDILPAYGDKPQWHIQADALNVVNDSYWDLVIAHPPCTYLSKAGATLLFPQPGILNIERYDKLLLARDFFMKFYTCNCRYVAIENPTPFHIANLPKYSQVIQPYEFGDPYSKRTLLWLKNLPPLFPTLYLVNHKSWTKQSSSPTIRSRTFQGIANAMALQWSSYILNDLY